MSNLKRSKKMNVKNNTKNTIRRTKKGGTRHRTKTRELHNSKNKHKTMKKVGLSLAGLVAVLGLGAYNKDKLKKKLKDTRKLLGLTEGEIDDIVEENNNDNDSTPRENNNHDDSTPRKNNNDVLKLSQPSLTSRKNNNDNNRLNRAKLIDRKNKHNKNKESNNDKSEQLPSVREKLTSEGFITKVKNINENKNSGIDRTKEIEKLKKILENENIDINNTLVEEIIRKSVVNNHYNEKEIKDRFGQLPQVQK